MNKPKKTTGLLCVLTALTCLTACEDDRESPPVCAEGSVFCTDNAEYQCTRGTALKLRDCENGCDNDTCRTTPPACTDSDTKCENNAAYVCAASQWFKSADCPNGCDGKSCRTEPACTDGDTKCENNATYICAAGQWIKSADCTNGCDGKSCKATAECTDSAKKCEDGAISVCLSGRWQKLIDCPYGCNGDICQSAPVCTNDDTKCENNAAYLCTNGQWLKSADCSNGCDGKSCKAAETPVCTDDDTKCENNAAYLCTDGQWVKSTDCTNGCDEKTCKPAAPVQECVDDAKKCENSAIYLCKDKAWTVQEACPYGCANDICREEQTMTPAPITCTSVTKSVCLDDHTAWVCSDYWSYDPEAPDLYIHHCADNHICVDGQCVVQSTAVCTSDYCKDMDTIVECRDGKATEKACGEGKLCSNRRCIDDTGIRTCTLAADCEEGDVCYDGLCYRASNMALKEGDPCETSGDNAFQEYCKDGKEYYCYGTVEIQDCEANGYNGCSLIIQDAFQGYGVVAPPKATRNAACRGTDEQLANCVQPGPTFTRCYNDDEYLSIHYSLTSTCVIGTDGRLVFIADDEQVACDSLCDDATGTCAE